MAAAAITGCAFVGARFWTVSSTPPLASAAGVFVLFLLGFLPHSERQSQDFTSLRKDLAFCLIHCISFEFSSRASFCHLSTADGPSLSLGVLRGLFSLFLRFRHGRKPLRPEASIGAATAAASFSCSPSSQHSSCAGRCAARHHLVSGSIFRFFVSVFAPIRQCNQTRKEMKRYH